MEVIMFIVGVLVGCILTKVVLRIFAVGSLRLDQSDPESSPYLFLELNKDNADDIAKKKFVVLNVYRKDFLPRK